MSKFIDRKGEHLNKKILIVESVDYDEAGNIKNLYVEEVRNDIPVEVEGTLLNATNLNTIIKQMIKEEMNSSNDGINNDIVDEGTTEVLTDAELLAADKAALTLVAETEADVPLTLTGTNGSVITWAVTEGDAASIEEGVLKVTRGSEDATVKLTATLTLGEATDTKEFELTVKAATEIEEDTTDSITLQVFPDGSSSGMASATFDIEPNSEVTIQNDYSFEVTANIYNDNKLTVTVFAGGYPEGGVLEASFKVIVKDKTTGVTTKEIIIIVEFLESLEDED